MPRPVMERLGSVRFACDHTRYDLLYAASRAATDALGTLVEHILKYMYGTPTRGLYFRYDPAGFFLHGYCDASWKQDPDCAAYIGYAAYLNTTSAAVCATSKKLKSAVLQSIFEAELIAIVECAKTLLHISNLIKELGIFEPNVPMIYTDSESAIAFINNKSYSTRKRHLEPKLLAIREWIEKNMIHVTFTTGATNSSDVLTKATTQELLNYHINKLMGSL